MSSPNHTTFDIEDAFSSTHSPDYTPASPDYVLALLRKTYSSSSNNSFVLVPLSSPTLSLFYDDPYMKVMHAYDAIIPPQVPIPLPINVPPSSMLSPIINPQEFFVPEELLSPNEQVIYTPTPPQIFEIGKSSIKMHLKHHEKHIEDILNYLEELSFHRIEKMEERLVNGWTIIQRYFEELKTELEKVCSRISRQQKKHIGKKDMIAFARFRISTLEITLKDIQAPKAAKMANTNNTNRNLEPKETPTARKCTYKEFMSCQPFYFDGTKGVVGLIRWFERTELVFYGTNCTEDSKVKFATGNDLKTYARRFQELATLCRDMVPNNEKLMEVFIGGLPISIEGNVTASKPQTLEEAINIIQRNTNNSNYLNDRNNNNHSNNHNNNNYQDNRNNYNRNNDYHQQSNRRQETIRAYATTSTENK
nr:hypothetical protein [Tanacetum cinerariifolium]